MANKSAVVEDLMTELGKSSVLARDKITQAVGEITLDLLSQNHGRFTALEKKQTITINTTDTAYKINDDFNTVKPPAIQVNSSGAYIRHTDIVSISEYYERQADTAAYPGEYYARIEYLTNQSDGPGDYLIFGAAPDATGYMEMFYYREPRGNDTGFIKNEFILKTGCRSRLSEFNPNWETDLKIYVRMREGFRENLTRKTTQLVLRPSPRIRDHNQMMHDIGQGG